MRTVLALLSVFTVGVIGRFEQKRPRNFDAAIFLCLFAIVTWGSVSAFGQSNWSSGYSYLGKSPEQEVIEKAELSDEDRALALSAKSRADSFLSYFDNKEFEKAAAMSFEKAIEPGNERRGRQRERIRITRVSASLLAAASNTYYGYGGMEKRTLVKVSMVGTWNGMSDAKYVVFKYEAKFPNKAELQPQRLVVKVSGDQSGSIVAFPYGI